LLITDISRDKHHSTSCERIVSRAVNGCDRKRLSGSGAPHGKLRSGKLYSGSGVKSGGSGGVRHGLGGRKMSISPHREIHCSRVRRWIVRTAKFSNFDRFCSCDQSL